MDDFEKEFPDFDWKNMPAYKHNVNKPYAFMNFIWHLNEGKLQGAKLEKQ